MHNVFLCRRNGRGDDPTGSTAAPRAVFTSGRAIPSATCRRRKRGRPSSNASFQRLKVVERCSFGEKFLIVRGDLRTYKIHLGSGNISCPPTINTSASSPRHRRPAGGKVFLPFEGDNLLSIILSKVFLLAEDGEVEGSTIVNQIRGR